MGISETRVNLNTRRQSREESAIKIGQEKVEIGESRDTGFMGMCKRMYVG